MILPFISACLVLLNSLASGASLLVNEPPKKIEVQTTADICRKQLSQFKKYPDSKMDIKDLCDSAQLLESCTSVEGNPIYHFDYLSDNPGKKRILVFSLIHGDELPAGDVGRYWVERLSSLQNPRNEWRVIPILNPDGVKTKSRLNARGVDLNRNFPTRDWGDEALDLWKKLNHNPRRFPGPEAQSEPETKCAVKHIEDFKPFFIVSIHTPLAVLDFDGPTLPRRVPYYYLPWRSLGHFPGSLGRYMWFERQVPVLTTELLSDSPKNTEPLHQLQDVIGSLVSWL